MQTLTMDHLQTSTGSPPFLPPWGQWCSFVPSLSANSPGEIPKGLSGPWKGSCFTSLVISGVSLGGSSFHCMAGGSESRTHPRSTDTNPGISFFRVVARRTSCSMFPQFPFPFGVFYLVPFPSVGTVGPHNSQAACSWFVTVTPHGRSVRPQQAHWFGHSLHIGCQLVSLGCRLEWPLLGIWFSS